MGPKHKKSVRNLGGGEKKKKERGNAKLKRTKQDF